MIYLAELTQADIGRWVEYRSSHGSTERGKLKGWSPRFIFVVYKCGGEWNKFQNYTGAATNPRDLKFIEMKGG